MVCSSSLPGQFGEGASERWGEAEQLISKKLADKWRLERVLGVGATSSVFEAIHNNGHRVAIKVLHRELAFNARVKSRFLREGYLANRVGHPGVVAVIDDGITPDGIVYLVLELLTGSSLAARAAQSGNVLDAREVLTTAHAVLDVLETAHDKGIIHRDIKPANIFMTDTGVIKVLDFGLARLCDVTSDIFQSGSGGLLGTPAYMAPEQARGVPGAATAQTDLWCLGATMFRLLTGQTVHSADTINQLIIVSATEAALPVRAVAPWLPEEIALVIDRALKLNPAERWESATHMRAALTSAIAVLTDPARPVRTGAPEAAARPTVPPPSGSLTTLPEHESSPGAELPAPASRRNLRRTLLLSGSAAFAIVAVPLVLLQDKLPPLALHTVELRNIAAPTLTLPTPQRAVTPASITTQVALEQPAREPRVAAVSPPIAPLVPLARSGTADVGRVTTSPTSSPSRRSFGIRVRPPKPRRAPAAAQSEVQMSSEFPEALLDRRK